MVGARELGEFAWSIENLLNRLLDNTLTRSPPILETLRAAVSALPELITQLESGAPVRSDIAAISSRAHALAAGRESARPSESEEESGGEGTAAPGHPLSASTVGRPVSPGAASATAPRAGSAPAAAAPAAAQRRAAAAKAPAPAEALAADGAARSLPDETLRDIYARETAAHVATVRGFLQREAELPEPHVLPEEVYRACHTLSGSSKMAQARHGIRLAEPLDHWLRRAYSSGAGLSGEELGLLQDCMAAMESVASHLEESTGFFLNPRPLLERIERADTDLDQRIAVTSGAAAAAIEGDAGSDAA